MKKLIIYITVLTVIGLFGMKAADHIKSIADNRSNTINELIDMAN